MSGDFVSRDVNRYLSEGSLIAAWVRIEQAFVAEDEEELRSRLLDARIHELFQFDGVPASGEESAERLRQVRNAVNKQATSSNRAQIADAVRKGIGQLSEAELRWNPGALSMWAWYFPALVDRRTEKINAAVEQIIRQYGPIGAADERDLVQRLSSSGLDEGGRQEALARISVDVVRIVPTLSDSLLKRIEAIDTANILELIRPQSWQHTPDLRYSAFDARPEHEDPVTVDELAEAISFFDSRRRQSNKDALLGLSEYCASDQELQDAVLSYHLVKVHEARQSGFPKDVVDDFQHRGLFEEEAARLLGQSTTTGVSPEYDLSPLSLPLPEFHIPVSNEDGGLDDEFDISFEGIQELLEQGKLEAAENALVRIPNSELHSTVEGDRTLTMISERREKMQTFLNEGKVKLAHQEFSQAIVAWRRAEEVANDVPEVVDFGSELHQIVTQRSVINSALGQAKLVKSPTVPGVDLEKKTNSPTGFFFKYIGPASLIDHLLFRGVDHYLVAVILLSIGVGILSALSAGRVRSGKKWPTVIGGIVVGMTLFINSYWFTLITVLIFLARYRKMYLSVRIKAWNGFIEKSENLFLANGLLAGVAGIYRYRSMGKGEQIFPTAGLVHRPVASKYQKGDEKVSLSSDCLVLLNGKGEIVTHIDSHLLPPSYRE